MRRLVRLHVLGRWRRSLQFRVVASALLVSLTVVALVGLLLYGQVADGVLDAQRSASVAEADSGLAFGRVALRDLRAGDDPDEVDAQLSELSGDLAARGGQAGAYQVLLLRAQSSAGFTSDVIEARDMPPGLRTEVVEERSLAVSYTTVTGAKLLVVGAPLDTAVGLYELYYVFPLDEQLATLALVRRTLLGGGVILSLLVAAIAGLVARQVVTPVRLAARTAEQFAGGLLATRMVVRGEDDLARLADAFNGMAASLQGKIHELEELSRVQHRFVADVSHELRTPLTTVRMGADVLHAARADFPPEVARSAELLQAELDRFESLLVDLLEISRFDAGAAVLDTEVVDLGELVRRLVEGMAPIAAQRDCEVTVRQVGDRDALVEADPRRVQRVLRNLLANGIEHGAGHPLEISVGADERAVAVVVRDHGEGLDAAEVPSVFNRFWRADASRARHTGGTGLGLSIAQEDARLHGGRLEAWGSVGEGCSFRLTLPRHVGHPFDRSPLPLEPEAVGSSG